MEYINELINFTHARPILCSIIGVILVAIVVLLILFRETKQVVEIVGYAIVEAEKACNSKKGQEKLDYAVKRVQDRLPKILSIFISKYIIVSIIEFMLNFIGKAFKVNKTVDIIGNEIEDKK